MLRPFKAAPLALYIHIPFCRSRCSYCAFNTSAGLDALIPAYVDATCREITWLGRRAGYPQLRTIYLGGGTPSILTPDQIGRILTIVADNFSIAHNTEISVESNPTGIDRQYCAAIRACGVNRLSIGAQTAQAGELRMFGRQHTWADVIFTVAAARAGGFENISLDLIYGAPGQTLYGWRETLQATIACESEHVSLYALGLEPGTALYRNVQSGRLAESDPDMAADMYNLASDLLCQAGYQQYEISNWARPGFECAHNLQYWRRVGGYLAVGAGAYGYLDQVRYGVVDSIKAYIEHIETTDLASELRLELLSLAEDPAKFETLNEETARSETMILGLRLLKEGVPRRAFEQRFGHAPENYYANEIRNLLLRDTITTDMERIVLRPHMRLVANQVMREFA